MSKARSPRGLCSTTVGTSRLMGRLLVVQPLGCAYHTGEERRSATTRLLLMIDRLVRRTVTLDAPAEEVWRLLTDEAELAGWLGTVDGDRLREPHGTERRFLVDDVREGSRLALTWWRDGQDGLDGQDASEVVFTLDETDEGTRVTVEERAVLAGGRTCLAGPAWGDRLLGLEVAVLSRS